MQKTTEMEFKVSGGRILDAKTEVMPNGVAKFTMNIEVDEAPSLILPNRKIVVLDQKIIHPKELECRIDPLAFPLDADWLQYEPKTERQMKIKKLFLDARAKDRLHVFTCMRIDPSIDPDTGNLVYRKGLPPAVGYSEKEWLKMLLNYDPSRNSRQMTRTEGICKRLLLIEKLVEEWKWEPEQAWYEVCDDSKKLGHFRDSDNPKDDFELTGSREVCGFYDLGNAYKLFTKDPWEEEDVLWAASGCYKMSGRTTALSEFYCHSWKDEPCDYGLAELTMD